MPRQVYRGELVFRPHDDVTIVRGSKTWLIIGPDIVLESEDLREVLREYYKEDVDWGLYHTRYGSWCVVLRFSDGERDDCENW